MSRSASAYHPVASPAPSSSLSEEPSNSCWEQCKWWLNPFRPLRMLRRDLSFLGCIIPAMRRLNRVAKLNGPGQWNAAVFWHETVANFGNRPAIIFGDRTMSFNDVEEAANRMANWALQHGYEQGDTIAMSLHNCPEVICILFAMAKIGVRVAFLNPVLTGTSLAHCIRICSVSRVIFTEETATAVKTLQNDDALKLDFVFLGDSSQCPDTSIAFNYESCSSERPSDDHRDKVVCSDTLMHIFTSGTTGLPKAAKIPHIRFFSAGLIMAYLVNIRPTDRFYTCLPLYHSSALMLGGGASWHYGIPLILAKKFSAREFWKDCIRYDATVVQYIGEICRYLCNQPRSLTDTQHSVRLAFGNGLREDVWKEFQARFNVGNIVEFYAATEGNVGFVNATNKPGAVGFMSPLLALKHPARFVRFDHIRGEPFRDTNGRCVKCSVDEVGETIGLIDERDAATKFSGYSDPVATRRKVIRDVFVQGDQYFRTGDLMRVDADGFVYFVDRIGDTFRWKGENVSTTQVEATLSDSCHLECVVYGVEIKGCEGRAGMTLIRKGENFSLEALYRRLQDQLPSFARPLFVRVSDSQLDAVTGTFKYQKSHLQKQGFDPSQIDEAEQIYFRDERVQRFVRLDQALYEEINNGSLRL